MIIDFWGLLLGKSLIRTVCMSKYYKISFHIAQYQPLGLGTCRHSEKLGKNNYFEIITILYTFMLPGIQRGKYNKCNLCPLNVLAYSYLDMKCVQF